MGELVFIYRKAGREPTDDVSDTVDALCVINIPGPFKPSAETPAFVLVADDYFTDYPTLKPVAVTHVRHRGPMAGGNYAGSLSSDWDDAVTAITGGAARHVLVSIHDRFEEVQ